jgi:hypothetical protein
MERVLALLRARAREGRPLNTVDFLSPTADGLKPILRLGARNGELRAAGYQIETRRARNRTADNYLHGEPRPVLASPFGDGEDQAPLFPADVGGSAKHVPLADWEAA